MESRCPYELGVWDMRMGNKSQTCGLSLKTTVFLYTVTQNNMQCTLNLSCAQDYKTKSGDQSQISSIWLAEMATGHITLGAGTWKNSIYVYLRTNFTMLFIGLCTCELEVKTTVNNDKTLANFLSLKKGNVFSISSTENLLSLYSIYTRVNACATNVDPDQRAHSYHLIWIYICPIFVRNKPINLKVNRVDQMCWMCWMIWICTVRPRNKGVSMDSMATVLYLYYIYFNYISILPS
jgi:hypothetical protein